MRKPGGKVCLVMLLVLVLCLFTMQAVEAGVSPGGMTNGTEHVEFLIGETVYIVDGEVKRMDVPPFIRDARTFIPVRYIAEALGAEASWGPLDALTEWVTMENEERLVTIFIGQYELKVLHKQTGYEQTISLDAAASIEAGRTFLPFRAISEAFGADVNYSSDERTDRPDRVWFMQVHEPKLTPPEPDNILTVLNAEVLDLKFFERGDFPPVREQRVYSNRFAKETSRYIYWELLLDFPSPQRRIDFSIEAIYSRDDGTLFGQHSIDCSVEPGWHNSYHFRGQGWDDPGQWPVGTYRVDLFSEGVIIASGSFEIYDAEMEEAPPEITRPQTGELIAGREPIPHRWEDLTIKNNSPKDAVVVVVSEGDPERIARAAYIRSGDSLTLDDLGIRRGEVYFMFGKNWDAQAKRFLTNMSYVRYVGVFEFWKYKYTLESLLRLLEEAVPVVNEAIEDFPSIS